MPLKPLMTIYILILMPPPIPPILKKHIMPLMSLIPLTPQIPLMPPKPLMPPVLLMPPMPLIPPMPSMLPMPLMSLLYHSYLQNSNNFSTQ